MQIIVNKSKDSFKPFSINLEIKIEEESDIKKLRGDFKDADLQYHCIYSHDENELPYLTLILEELEKAL